MMYTYLKSAITTNVFALAATIFSCVWQPLHTSRLLMKWD